MIKRWGGTSDLLLMMVLVFAVLMAARVLLWSASAEVPVPVGTWRGGDGCSAPFCVLNPDSVRYTALTEYFVAKGPTSDQPLALLGAGDDYEGSFLGASKNGVSYAYVSSLIVLAAGVSSSTSNSILSLLSALAIALLVARSFKRRQLPKSWLVAVVVSPVCAFYGNQVMKETWSALLLLAIVDLCDRAAERELRHPAASVVYGCALAALLYFDREYYLFVGLGVGAWLLVASVSKSRTRRVLSVAAIILFGILLTVRAGHTIAPLRSYHVQYAPDEAVFGSPSDLLIGIPRTLFAPLGGIADSTQTVLLVLTIPIYLAYIACFYLTVRGMGMANASGGVGVRDPRVVAFFGMAAMWTLTYGGGFARGRDALAPLLFVGVARWQQHVLVHERAEMDVRLRQTAGAHFTRLSQR